jgi:methyl-accepting chemotaxis protein
MIETRIEPAKPADPAAMDRIAKACGEVAVGCTDAGGLVDRVAESISGQITVLDELQAVMASLETDQRQVTDATDEARLLAESARARLTEGARTISASVSEFSELTALVLRLGQQIGSFATAMQQVRRTADTIDTIARTTNMLALNAAIEAERAGDGGRTFAVVAAEVKKLALDTRAATEEIGQTMDSLSREGAVFMGELQDGMARSRAAEKGLARVTETVGEVTHLVEQVDAQAADIARATSMIHESVCRVGEELDGFSNAARANSGLLGDTRTTMGGLERKAHQMLDTIVHSGFAVADRRLVDIAVALRDRFVDLTTTALQEGRLDSASLFDTDYRPIPGSNPARFDTRLNIFADAEWRPELDLIVQSDPCIISTACTDVNGYLPTHSMRYSRTPTGDPAHDAAWCRNRRILADETDRIAKASSKPFHIAVFRRDRDDGGYDVVRNVYVPMIIDGRRWGDFEIAYRVD